MNEKYIYFRCGKWSVEIRHKQYGRYNTKEEARKVRDELIEQMKKETKN